MSLDNIFFTFLLSIPFNDLSLNIANFIKTYLIALLLLVKKSPYIFERVFLKFIFCLNHLINMCADSTSEVMFWGFSALFLELPLCAKRYRQITWLNTISLLNLTKFFPHATKCTLLLCTTAHSVFCCYESYQNSIECFSYTQEIAGNSYFLLFPLYERSLNFFIGVSCAALVRTGSTPGWTSLPRKLVSVVTAILHFKVILAWIGID